MKRLWKNWFYWPVKNWLTYRKVVRSMLPWDYAYSLRLWVKSLEQLRGAALNSHFQSGMKDAEDIARLIYLLERVINDDWMYEYEDLTELGKKWEAEQDEIGSIIKNQLTHWWY